ncbi:protein serine/threonine kinase, putative, partial [Entamoeba invadens IP1]|uniref:protein serine/threonine kinase, putative n=1 Tax=Entamoeba invadens IP1 TaxID=370355 RepID=UPI0002C3E1EE
MFQVNFNPRHLPLEIVNSGNEKVKIVYVSKDEEVVRDDDITQHVLNTKHTNNLKKKITKLEDKNQKSFDNLELIKSIKSIKNKEKGDAIEDFFKSQNAKTQEFLKGNIMSTKHMNSEEQKFLLTLKRNENESDIINTDTPNTSNENKENNEHTNVVFKGLFLITMNPSESLPRYLFSTADPSQIEFQTLKAGLVEFKECAKNTFIYFFFPSSGFKPTCASDGKTRANLKKEIYKDTADDYDVFDLVNGNYSIHTVPSQYTISVKTKIGNFINIEKFDYNNVIQIFNQETLIMKYTSLSGGPFKLSTFLNNNGEVVVYEVSDTMPVYSFQKNYQQILLTRPTRKTTTNVRTCDVSYLTYNTSAAPLLASTCLSCNDNYSMTTSGTCECLYNDVLGKCSLLNCETYLNGKCHMCGNAYYYDVATDSCKKCGLKCSQCKISNSCELCQRNTGVYIFNGKSACAEIDCCASYILSKCIKCLPGYFLIQGKCGNCIPNCAECTYFDNCDLCDHNYMYNGTACVLQNKTTILNPSFAAISCDPKYCGKDSMCVECSSLFSDCIECNSESCLQCDAKTILKNGKCIVESVCTSISLNFCFCGMSEISSGDKCMSPLENCDIRSLDSCKQCFPNYNLTTTKTCTQDPIEDSCRIPSEIGCLSCKQGYYITPDLTCETCDEKCTTCIAKNFCLTCPGGMFVSNGVCKQNGNLEGKCKTFSVNGGCAQCKDGYFRVGFDCELCSEECETCLNNKSCLSCNKDYWMSETNECKSKNGTYGCAGDITTDRGCLLCIAGYYLSHRECQVCSSSCKTCIENVVCTSCDPLDVYNDKTHTCLLMSNVSECLKVEDSKCTKCSFWYSVDESGTLCATHAVWWVILLVVLLTLVVVSILLFFVLKLVNYLIKEYQTHRREKSVCVFKMSRSNVNFNNFISPGIFSNKKKLSFNDDDENIKVGDYTRELICFGNKNAFTVKLQIVTKSTAIKYQLKTLPQIITLRKDEACEFEAFVKPRCTCKIADFINVTILVLKSGETFSVEFPLTFETEVSTYLDPDEILREKKIGEGGFGVVYKGRFRGSLVAIKKMKEIYSTQEFLGEFENEMSMLDKFRCDYIIHFYGACVIKSEFCLVTEYAEYGSLKDFILKESETKISKQMKIKICIDASRGIQYLHSNGILHRDVKPDNILLVSLEYNLIANAKLTDFGTSRNINMLMTNMTFTKGVGTPIYMAPEILLKEKYKKSADIYSFGITLFECFGWREAYPVAMFPYAWNIAEFVSNGNRLQKPGNMEDEIYQIASKCWRQDMNQRVEIGEVVKLLEGYYSTC